MTRHMQGDYPFPTINTARGARPLNCSAPSLSSLYTSWRVALPSGTPTLSEHGNSRPQKDPRTRALLASDLRTARSNRINVRTARHPSESTARDPTDMLVTVAAGTPGDWLRADWHGRPLYRFEDWTNKSSQWKRLYRERSCQNRLCSVGRFRDIVPSGVLISEPERSSYSLATDRDPNHLPTLLKDL
jgi:hypothetical protein